MSRIYTVLVGIVSLSAGIFIGAIAAQYFRGETRTPTQESETPKLPFEIDTLEVIGDVVIAKQDLEDLPQIPGVDNTRDFRDALEKAALFYNAAKEKGITEDPKAQRMVYWAEKGVYADLYYQRYILPLIRVDTSSVDSFLKANREVFTKEVAMLTVIFKDPKMADTLKKLLKDGSYAANLMLEEFAKRGKIVLQPSPFQNLGLAKFAMSEEEFKTLKNAKVGDVVGPFQVAPGTYAVSKIVEIRRVSLKEIPSQVRSLVYNYLLDMRRREVEDSVIKVLKEKFTGGER